MSNPYTYDSWEWCVQDRLCRKVADELRLCYWTSKWGDALRAILVQKPMMYPPTRQILKMITFNTSPDSVAHWSVCSEFCDLADFLLPASGERP